jgi:hypothetical protein
VARFMVEITKSVPFQGRTEETANLYAVECGPLDPNFTDLINHFVAAEKPIFSTAVSFIRGRVWDIGLPPNTMREVLTLTGTGSQTDVPGYYRECCILVKWPLPRSTASGSSRQRSLKKFLHTCCALSGTVLGGTATLPAIATIPNLAAYITAVTSNATLDFDLVSPSGAVPSGPAVLHPYLEHRQFPRGRKQT